MHFKEKVKCKGMWIAHIGLCVCMQVCVCVLRGAYCCGNVETHITVLHLDSWVHVSLQPDPQ